MLDFPIYCWQRIFHMDFTQLQDRVRLELLRRIERGTVSVSLLSRQTGLGQPHLSNFLHGRRSLSLRSLDRILGAQHLAVADLLPARRGATDPLKEEEVGEVVRIPLVSGAVAAFEPYIRVSSVVAMLAFSGEALKGVEARCASARKQWDRYVAVRIGAEDARAMEPVLELDGVVVLDRHYTSFHPYRAGRANLYGARVGVGMVLRYAQYDADRVVLRALRGRVKAEVLEPGLGETGSDLLVGRVVVIENRE
jgi:transcriptional regulator with XRE-family HTH domain